MKHLHYEIHAYSRRQPYPIEQISGKLAKKEYQMGGVIILDIQANSEKEAMLKVKQMVRKRGYRLARIYECHSPDIDQSLSQEVQLIQLELQKKMYDLLKPNA